MGRFLSAFRDGTKSKYSGIQYHNISGIVVRESDFPEFSTTIFPEPWYEDLTSRNSVSAILQKGGTKPHFPGIQYHRITNERVRSLSKDTKTPRSTVLQGVIYQDFNFFESQRSSHHE